MNKGAFLIARNNGHIDYVKQAVFLAKRIKKYLNIPVTIATDSPEYLETAFGNDDFDNVITLEHMADFNMRYFFDGALSKKSASFKNDNRAGVYDLTPYDETLILDTDYVISNNLLASCFESESDFMIYKKSDDVAKIRNEKEFDTISNTSVDFYWATVVYFKKTEANNIFFELVKHVEKEWNHYRRVYQITSMLFRNDFAFSIAIHIMNGFQKGSFAQQLPGSMLYTTDKDVLWQLDEDEMMFLVEKKDYLGEYTALKTRGQTIHVMNKSSLNRIIDKEFAND
jgi:hypothetical protein|tara:strand:+ start:175 stop:1026 length:852 start_codon:yes stop_codon:yes gene_type:complete